MHVFNSEVVIFLYIHTYLNFCLMRVHLMAYLFVDV